MKRLIALSLVVLFVIIFTYEAFSFPDENSPSLTVCVKGIESVRFTRGSAKVIINCSEGVFYIRCDISNTFCQSIASGGNHVSSVAVVRTSLLGDFFALGANINGELSSYRNEVKNSVARAHGNAYIYAALMWVILLGRVFLKRWRS